MALVVIRRPRRRGRLDGWAEMPAWLAGRADLASSARHLHCVEMLPAGVETFISVTIASIGSIDASVSVEQNVAAEIVGIGSISGFATVSGAVYTDTFTDVAGTLLTAHVPDNGGTWTKVAGNDNVITSANRVRQSGTFGSSSLHYHGAVSPGADYDVSGQITYLSAVSNSSVGVIGRYDVATDSCYMCRHTATLFQLFRRVNGVFSSVLASSSFSPTTGVPFLITLRMIGSTIKVLRDGVEIITYNDATPVTGAGRAGIVYSALTVAVTDTTGPHLDDFRGVEIPSGGEETFISTTIAGTGSIAASTSIERNVAAQIAGIGSIAASMTQQIVMSATISGVGSIQASPTISGETTASATIAGIGSIAASMTQQIVMSATISGVGSIQASPTTHAFISGLISGVGSIAASVSVERKVAAQIAGTGSIQAVPQLGAATFVSATIAGVGSIEAFAEVWTVTVVGALIAGVGTITAEAIIAGHGHVDLEWSYASIDIEATVLNSIDVEQI